MLVTLNHRLEDEMHHPLPLHLESLPLPRDTLCSFPSVGTVLRVVSQDIENDNLRLLKTGEWVKLLNLLCEVHAGLWRCVLTPFTKLRYTPNEDRLKLERQRSLLLAEILLSCIASLCCNLLKL